MPGSQVRLLPFVIEGEMEHELKRPWTRKRIIDEIRALHRRGLPLNGQKMIRRMTLYGHARRLFGNWEKAIRASGLNYDEIALRRLWTKTAILQWIRTENKTGRDLRPGVTKKKHSGVFNAALREFGSWYGAIRKAGIRSFPEVRFNRWSKEKIIRAIRDLRQVPPASEIAQTNPSLMSATSYHFGGWRPAVEAAGRACPSGACPFKWTRETILRIIKERLSRGQDPQSTSFKDLGAFVRAASRQFSGWRNAVKAAGFSTQKLMASRYVWKRNEVLRVIRERDQAGLSNAVAQAERECPGLTRAGHILFGSWPSAVRAAGCALPDKAKWTRSSLTKHLIAHAEDGFAPRARELGESISAAACRLFGSLRNAAREAGLRLQPQRCKWTRERVLKGVKRRLRQGLPLSGDARLMQAVLRRYGGVAGVERALSRRTDVSTAARESR